jgi:Gpi18-like mannosyltransferase
MDSLKRTRIEVFLLFALYLLLLPRVYMDYDMGFWRQWALYIHEHGLSAAYSGTSPINYFPVFVYGLYVYDLLQGTEANIIIHINDIKVLFVCFDFLPVVVLACFRQRILSYKIPYLYLLLNIAYVFNSLVWGQIDSIYTSLAFLAMVTAIFYPVTGILLYLLALNTKPQAIEFLPVMALVIYYSVRHIKTILAALAGLIALQLVLLLPFISNGGVTRLADIALHSVGRYNNLSICAFNMWYLITRDNPYFIKDTDVYFLLSYKAIGLILFTASVLMLVIPLAKKIRRLRTAGMAFDETGYQALFLGTGLLCLYFFYFNSQMHERYAQPIILFFFFYSVASGNYKLYILASIPYFLSLDKCFSYPDGYLPIVHYKIIYASKILALWYTATVIYGSYLWWQLAKKLNSPVTAAG